MISQKTILTLRFLSLKSKLLTRRALEVKVETFFIQRSTDDAGFPCTMI